MQAVFNANLESVNYVLSKGANVNAQTPKGETALVLAIKKNKLAIVKKLVEAGADVNHKELLLSSNSSKKEFELNE